MCSHRSGRIYQEIHVKFHSSANSGQEPDFLIRRAAKKMTFTADRRKKYACMCSHRSGHIYQEIHVKFYSSANSGQEPDSLFAEQRKK